MPYYGYGGYGPTPPMAPRRPAGAPPVRPVRPFVTPLGEEDLDPYAAPPIVSALAAEPPGVLPSTSGTRNYAPQVRPILPPSQDNPEEVEAPLQKTGPANAAETAIATQVKLAETPRTMGANELGVEPPSAPRSALDRASRQALGVKPGEAGSVGVRAVNSDMPDFNDVDDQVGPKRERTAKPGVFTNADLDASRERGGNLSTFSTPESDREQRARELDTAKSEFETNKYAEMAADPLGEKAAKAKYDAALAVEQERTRARMAPGDLSAAMRDLKMQLTEYEARVDAAVQAGQIDAATAEQRKAEARAHVGNKALQLQEQVDARSRTPPLQLGAEATFP